MKSSIEAPCSEAPSAPVEIRVPAVAGDDDSQFEEHLGVELGLAPWSKVANEADSKVTSAPKEEHEPTAENDAPREEADWERYKLPRPELLGAVAATAHTVASPALPQLTPGALPETSVGAAPSGKPRASERGSAGPNQASSRVGSAEPSKSLAVELGLARWSKVPNEADSKETTAPKVEREPSAESDAPREEADWERYKLPRPELLLGAVAAGAHTSPGVHVALPGETSVGAAPSVTPRASERGPAGPNQARSRVGSAEPTKTLAVAVAVADAGPGVVAAGARSAKAATVSARLASVGMVSVEESAPRESGETSSPPLDATAHGTTVRAPSTNRARLGSGPMVDPSDRSRATHVDEPSVMANGSPGAERPNEAPLRRGVERSLENQRAERHDGKSGAEPSAVGSTPTLVPAGANAENGAAVSQNVLGRATEAPSESPRGTEPVEPPVAVQPDRIIEDGAPTGDGASKVEGVLSDGRAIPRGSPDERRVARPKGDVPTAPVARKRTALDTNPNEASVVKAPMERVLPEKFQSSAGPGAIDPAPPNGVQRTARGEAALVQSSSEHRVSTGAAGEPGSSRKRQTGAEERPNGSRSAAKPLASSEDVPVRPGGNGMDRGVLGASAHPGTVDVNPSASVKPMTVDDGALPRSADVGKGAVRVAEAVGHRRALASEANGAVTLEHVGRFEVRARPHEGGRVEVHVRAEHEAGSAMLGAHANELRADLRAAIPHATVEVTTPETAGGSYGPRERSSGDASRDPRDRPTSAGVLSADAEQTLTPSWNRRSARVRIVL